MSEENKDNIMGQNVVDSEEYAERIANITKYYNELYETIENPQMTVDELLSVREGTTILEYVGDEDSLDFLKGPAYLVLDMGKTIDGEIAMVIDMLVETEDGEVQFSVANKMVVTEKQLVERFKIVNELDIQEIAKEVHDRLAEDPENPLTQEEMESLLVEAVKDKVSDVAKSEED